MKQSVEDWVSVLRKLASDDPAINSDEDSDLHFAKAYEHQDVSDEDEPAHFNKTDMHAHDKVGFEGDDWLQKLNVRRKDQDQGDDDDGKDDDASGAGMFDGSDSPDSSDDDKMANPHRVPKGYRLVRPQKLLFRLGHL
jgi:hypothetical protein